MSSIEECMDILENKSEELFYKYRQNLDKFYKDIRLLKNLKILGNEIEKDDIYDKGKIVIITKDTNINGQKLANVLREKYNIEVEMAYTNYVIAMTSIAPNPIRDLADIRLNTVEMNSNFRSTALSPRISQLTVIDMLYVKMMLENKNMQDYIFDAIELVQGFKIK